jgi:hypothetical protein
MKSRKPKKHGKSKKSRKIHKRSRKFGGLGIPDGSIKQLGIVGGSEIFRRSLLDDVNNKDYELFKKIKKLSTKEIALDTTIEILSKKTGIPTSYYKNIYDYINHIYRLSFMF